MKVAIYSRKSVYTGKGESIENQVEMCKNYIKDKLQDVTDDDIVIYEDEGFSAKNLKRPQFQKMLNDVASKKIQCIICYRLDRISRNVSDFSSLIEHLNEKNIAFICIKEQFDTSTPMGRAMMYIASVFAQLERETIAERVRDNMFMLARSGRWLGGSTPTGFTSEKEQTVVIDGKKKSSCNLKTIPEEIQLVKTIYQKFLEIKSISGVSKYLISKNIKSKVGTMLSLLSIKEILINPVYCIADEDARNYFIEQNSDVCFSETECSDKYGLLAYNKRNYSKKSSPRNTKDQWIISKGKHKGIVCGKDWVYIQNLISLNAHPSHSNTHNNYAMLSGTILCSKCGQRMFAKQRHQQGRKPGFDYICNGKMRGGTKLCDCSNLNGSQIDDMVCEYIMKYAEDGSDIFKKIKHLKEKFKKDIPVDPIKEVNANIQKCNSEIDKLIQNLTQISDTPSIIARVNERLIELDGELQALLTEKQQLEDIKKPTEQKQSELEAIVRLLSDFKSHYSELSIVDKRQIMDLLIDRIEWDGNELHIFMHGE